MQKIFVGVSAVLLLVACGNRSREAEPIFSDSLTVAEQSEYGIVADSVQKEEIVTDEKAAVPVNSLPSQSSQSHESGDYDNMRGFDPASEDDMEDNGMSRYMENNDEEGWY